MACLFQSAIKIIPLRAWEVDLQQAQFGIATWQAWGLMYLKLQLKLSLCEYESSTYNKRNIIFPLVEHEVLSL